MDADTWWRAGALRAGALYRCAYCGAERLVAALRARPRPCLGCGALMTCECAWRLVGNAAGLSGDDEPDDGGVPGSVARAPAL